MQKKFLPNERVPLPGPWGNLPPSERTEVIENVWKGMSVKEKESLQMVREKMDIKALGIKSVLSLIVSLYLDERTREAIEGGFFGKDTEGGIK